MTIRPRHYAELIVSGDSQVVVNRLATLEAVAHVQRQLSNLLRNPTTASRVTDLFDQLHCDPEVRGLIDELTRTGRLSWLAAITRLTEQLMISRRTVAIARVSVTREDVVDRSALTLAIEAVMGMESSLVLSEQPTQLGGIAVQVGGRSFDQRLDHRVERVRMTLRDTSRAPSRERTSL